MHAGNPWSQSRSSKGRLLWEGFTGNEGFKTGMKEWGWWMQTIYERQLYTMPILLPATLRHISLDSKPIVINEQYRVS